MEYHGIHNHGSVMNAVWHPFCLCLRSNSYPSPQYQGAGVYRWWVRVDVTSSCGIQITWFSPWADDSVVDYSAALGGDMACCVRPGSPGAVVLQRVNFGGEAAEIVKCIRCMTGTKED